MKVDLLEITDIEFGERIEVIALCSKVEVKQNLSTTGSYREIYHINGRSGAFISGIIFKDNSVPKVEIEAFEDEPVYVIGTVGEYRDVLQIHIESITPLPQLDKDDILAEMVDTTMIDNINDILYEQGTHYQYTFRHLKPALGLEETGAGTMAERVLKFFSIARIHYPEESKEYIKAVGSLTELYLNTEVTVTDRLGVIEQQNTELIRALLFNVKEYPELEEFVKLHHLIMKPRGYILEILDSAFVNNSNSSSDI